MNNNQNTTFHQLGYFIKTCRSPAGTGFNKNPNLAIRKQGFRVKLDFAIHLTSGGGLLSENPPSKHINKTPFRRRR
ncbi:hypothetical protein SPBRAN_359 [uncultured Candidatus Thioglobus sp.]|nr:hypothetical protein SPBRAN_359 [uncultured Candidatus Thioglobus sp.]